MREIQRASRLGRFLHKVNEVSKVSEVSTRKCGKFKPRITRILKRVWGRGQGPNAYAACGRFGLPMRGTVGRLCETPCECAAIRPAGSPIRPTMLAQTPDRFIRLFFRVPPLSQVPREALCCPLSPGILLPQRRRGWGSASRGASASSNACGLGSPRSRGKAALRAFPPIQNSSFNIQHWAAQLPLRAIRGSGHSPFLPHAACRMPHAPLPPAAFPTTNNPQLTTHPNNGFMCRSKRLVVTFRPMMAAWASSAPR